MATEGVGIGMVAMNRSKCQATEVQDYCQDDLAEDDVMILDPGTCQHPSLLGETGTWPLMWLACAVGIGLGH